jgi:hypothetical protein
LAAENGVLVSADFTQGKLRLAEIRSSRGGRCQIRNPWPVTVITDSDEQVVRQTDAATIDMETDANAHYVLQPADRNTPGDQARVDR